MSETKKNSNIFKKFMSDLNLGSRKIERRQKSDTDTKISKQCQKVVAPHFSSTLPASAPGVAPSSRLPASGTLPSASGPDLPSAGAASGLLLTTSGLLPTTSGLASPSPESSGTEKSSKP